MTEIKHNLIVIELFGKASQKRDLVDIFRVQYWCAGLRRALNCQTAYQLEKRIEPHHFKYENQRTIYPNKWNRYANGENTPQKRLVKTVDMLVVGSARELNHPLWELLKNPRTNPNEMIDEILKLDRRVQTIIFSGYGKDQIIRPFHTRVGRKLLKCGNLDALAGLILYWDAAYRRDKVFDLQKIAELIYFLLLIIGQDLRKRELDSKLLYLCIQRIFNFTPWSHGKFAIDAKSYIYSIILLNELSPQVVFGHKTLNKQKQVDWMGNFLTGLFGFSLVWALKPFCLPSWDVDSATSAKYLKWEEYRSRWASSWDKIRAWGFDIKTGSNLSNQLKEPDINQFLTGCVIVQYGNVFTKK